MHAIEFNNVWKKFKKGEKFNSLRDFIPNLLKPKSKDEALQEQEFWAVKNVDFRIKKGEIVGIMGPNGAGKSTILKLLSKLIVPTKGEMRINGRLSALIEVTAGFHPELTGRENVYLNATILGMRKKEIDAKFEDIVEFSGVREFIDTPVKRYSSGMGSRLGFSVAVHMNPEILLVDEVLAVGDISFQAKCAEKIRQIMHSGATIILVSHQLNMIQSLCSRVILLEHGQLVMDGDVNDVIPHYQNIVIKQKEEEVRKVINSIENKVQLAARPLVSITDIELKDGSGAVKNTFLVQDAIEIAMSYNASQPIEDPIVVLEVLRNDHVLCCSCRSDENQCSFDIAPGNGVLAIKLGKLALAPGVYAFKFAIWDKKMIHTYAVRSQDIFRVSMDGSSLHHSDAIFIPKIEWIPPVKR